MLTTLFLAILFCFASCDNSTGLGFVLGSGGNSDSENSQSDQNNQFGINYSLGDPPKSDPLPEDKYSIDEKISEGIYIEFDIPTSENYWATRVYIEGLGPVAEEVQYTDQSRTRGCFYYPFVEAGKEYTIRFVFLRKEEQNEEGFVIDYKGDDGSIGWFETNVTAGSQSKGEVRFTSKGKIYVDKKDNFKFTQRPTFQNEHLLTENGNDWKVEIGLVEGISWDHGSERKTKWYGQVEIHRTNLTDTCNLFEMCPWVSGIDFICVRPIMYYEHDEKTYKYQWDSFVQDIYYPPKADSLETIDISNPSQVSKIFGTWEYKTGWDYDSPFGNTVIPIKVKQNKTLTISVDVQNLESTIIEVITKRDDSAFTQEEENHFIMNYDEDTSKAMSKISDDRKQITQQYWEKTTLSEYFESWGDDDYTRHYELKSFDDELRVIGYGKDNGESYQFCDTYKKQ